MRDRWWTRTAPAGTDRGVMRNATIATSRTRATTDDPLIDYRPLPSAWGDVKALRSLRWAKARAAHRGADPTTAHPRELRR